MEQWVTEDFKGVISIEQNRKWIYKQARGEADLANGRPNRLETKFCIAGGSKVFTAAGILKLIEKKLLAFEDTLGRVLPYDLGQIDKKVTIRQLLNHTAGVPEYLPKESADLLPVQNFQPVQKAYLRTPRDYLPMFTQKPMQFAPGSCFSYSNTGYVLLSLIIEKISEMPFDVFLKRNVFDPAGMKDTGYYSLDRLPAACATGYCYDQRQRVHYANIFSIEPKGSGAGGAYTTAADLEQFWLALQEGRLLSRPLVREMLSPQVDEGFYGYGVWLQEQDADEHDYLPFIQGEAAGISFISSFDKKTKRSITLISNFGCDVIKLHGQFYSQLVDK